ncbi:MAG: transglutaminase domain-containing protein [Calditrichia bacterium]
MKKIYFSEVLIKGIFKIVPTVAIIFYLWSLSTFSTSEFHTNLQMNLIMLASGMTIAYFVYSYRLRFSLSFALLAGILYAIYLSLADGSGGEFDSFYQSVAFSVYAVVFLLAWIAGYGFARHDYFPWIISVGVFVYAAGLLVTNFISLEALVDTRVIRLLAGQHLAESPTLYRIFAFLLSLFLPVLFYCIYLIFVNDVLRKVSLSDKQTVLTLLRKSVSVAGVLAIILLTLIMAVRYLGLPNWLYETVNQAQVSSSSFLKKTYNEGTNQPEFDLNDYAQLLPEVELSDETVFCTYIDNFLPTETGENVPLPLHFRRFVLNRFEPASEKFVLDPYPPSAIPNDLFSPSTKDVPIGFSIEDPIIEKETKAYDNRKNVASTVYVQALNPDAYLAPNTGYSYQRLPVPPEDKETFHTVYQCSSLVSIWNLPPFVYSSTQPDLVDYRELRAKELRKNRGYEKIDSTFMQYYTQYDTTDSLIRMLSNNLTEGISNPYEKVDAIVNYMTGDEEDGEPRFTYTLKPGSPEDVNQSLMHYFLFDNKQGYCTYFAGATTLLLRAAGIPCRMVVGYAIFDRSNKNTGWYWVYADQGHAWLEVYFPEHGWIDFDTTPSDDTEPNRPPKPDATPPEYAREPFLALLGQVTGYTADSTALLVKPYTMRYKSKAYEITEDETEVVSIRPNGGVVTVDGEKRKIGDFKIGAKTVVSAYSFDYDLEKVRRYRGRQSFMSFYKKYFPKEVSVDEAIIVYEDETDNTGQVFAVNGFLQSVDVDSGYLTVLPQTITYREKSYPIEPRKARPIVLKPEEAVIYSDNKKVALNQIVISDSMRITAESSSSQLHEIKPFLATEPFRVWFRNSFPEIIPIDKASLELPAVPIAQRIGWGLLFTALAVVVGLLLLATLLYLYLTARSRAANASQKPYWVYQYAMMVLNQLGFTRSRQTPMEYAETAVDPALSTEFRQFMSLYQKSKYAPQGLAPAEEEFLAEFKEQFSGKLFKAIPKKKVLLDFLDFRRALRYLFARN